MKCEVHFNLWRKGDVYDFMLFSNPYIEIFLQEIKTFREKHKIIDVPFIPWFLFLWTHPINEWSYQKILIRWFGRLGWNQYWIFDLHDWFGWSHLEYLEWFLLLERWWGKILLPGWCLGLWQGAYVQFRGNEFHTRNARFRQPQEQRRAKAHSRQAKRTCLT